MTEDILAWSVCRASGSPTFSRVNICELVQECCLDMEEAARAKGNVIVNSAPSWSVMSDRKLLRLVLSNLFSNAIKFTENGSITCSAAVSREGNVCLSVSDTGIGMSEDVFERLFDWNRAASAPGTRNEYGAGIGLLLCQDFLETIGGSIEAESAPGAGAVFRVMLKTRLLRQHSKALSVKHNGKQMARPSVVL